MQQDTFSQFADFSGLDRDALTTLQRHARALHYPAGRTLLRGGRRLQGRYYLLAGVVQTGRPDAVIEAGSPGARQPLYPGAAALTTLAPTTLLHVDWEKVGFLAGSVAAPFQTAPFQTMPFQTTPFQNEGWQERFLLSPMMKRMCPQEWRTILMELEPQAVSRAQRVIAEGQTADGCYVLRTGHAVVHAGRHTFAYLMPGDFFGEDALVTGRVRNASITMLEDGVVLRMPEAVFRQMLLEPVVPQVHAPGRGVLVNAGYRPIEGAVQVSLRWLRQQLRKLDRNRAHYVVGGGEDDRSLAALILIQAGFRAYAVLD